MFDPATQCRSVWKMNVVSEWTLKLSMYS
jgi:hypothetical protein